MKRVGLLILICMIILLSGCNLDNDDENTNDELWNSVVNIEFIAGNFMGESIFFYEKDSEKYCDFWMSGSGVPAIFFHTSEVEIDEAGNIIVETPTIFLGASDFSDDLAFEKIKVEYTDGIIYLNGVKYEDFDLNTRDEAIEWIGQAVD